MSSISTKQALPKATAVFPTLPPIHWTERYFRLLWGSVGIVGCLLLWQIGSSLKLWDPLFVSSPLEVLGAAVTLIPS